MSYVVKMDEKNKTIITVIQLLGFQTPQALTFVLFFLFLLMYCVTICGNLLIITLVSYSKTLHSPMYFFLSQLSVMDILLTTDVFPYMLHSMLEKDSATMSISNCIIQFYFFAVSETSECLLLTVMSYDRYVAICKPLHYTLLMSTQFCWITILTSWILSFLSGLIYTIEISKLQFCSPNVIDHFFCDLGPILKLSCSDTTIVQLESTLINVVFACAPVIFIIVSYVYIIVTIFKIPSITGRQKVFSTCSSHLIVVSMFYGTLIFVYLIPRRGQLLNITKFISLLYTTATPMINPIIYSLRNKDLKQVIDRIVNNFLKMHLHHY
ncbi:olfactory receptor 1468-like [Rana temporaria]|uniref:olfactory receptor 1468-like n=1 Tax=Rana temporaria TaxID=8407 RepID=UPI001AAC97DD|nr:olfactory receptor 1468-like [Rana temporaria]